jgi:hypothetical protein
LVQLNLRTGGGLFSGDTPRRFLSVETWKNAGKSAEEKDATDKRMDIHSEVFVEK